MNLNKLLDRLEANIKNKNEVINNVVEIPKKVQYLAQEEYVKFTYDEYKKQKILRIKLREIGYVPMLPKLRIVIDEMIQGGIILQEDDHAGFKILPIIGEKYFTKERYLELKKRILDDSEMVSVIREKLKLLSECWHKTMYSIGCENRKENCDMIHDSCYLSKCRLGLKKFEEDTRLEYENLQK